MFNNLFGLIVQKKFNKAMHCGKVIVFFFAVIISVMTVTYTYIWQDGE